MRAGRPGYIALLSVLIVAAMAAATVLILFITSITATLNSADTFNGKLAKALAEGCMERALQSLTICNLHCKTGAPSVCTTGSTPACPVTIASGSNSCVVHSLEETAANTWRLRATGTAGTVKKYMEVHATKLATDLAADTTSWKECTDFTATPCPVP